MSYPALCIIVYVWQAEHIALEQPLSQLSSTDIVVRIKQEDEFWAPLLGGGGCCLQSSTPTRNQNIEMKRKTWVFKHENEPR